LTAPKLSVVVSSYNQRGYITACLDSILAQEVDFPFEVVVSDDFSTDGTRGIINDYAARHPELIRVLPNTENVGPARNYFRAHNAARGEYVAHIDGDDLMLPEKLQRQVAILDAHPECVLVNHRSRYFNDTRTYVTETGELPNGEELIFYTIAENARWGTIAVHSSYMYRASARKTREYRGDFMEWYFTMEYLSEPGSRACFINRVLVEYRCNESNQAYLASRHGRQRSYRILIGHLMDNFGTLTNLRKDIYAHAFLNILTYHKSVRTFSPQMFWFLARHINKFDFARVRETIRIRRAVSPQKRIR
jgi:glycosyltransferase involved in cell wall biosynthesis